jgi:hypothetical protein
MHERLPRIKWPHTYPICMLFGIVLALSVTAATAYIQFRLLPPVQRYYLGPYFRVCLLPMGQNLQLVEVWNGDSYVFALDPWMDVQTLQHATRLSVTPQGALLGLSRPRLTQFQKLKPQAIRPFFERTVYRATLPKIFRPTLCVFAIALAAGMMIGGWFDQRHQHAARKGVQIRGPRMLTARQARRYLKGDGIALLLEPRTK